MGQKLQCLVVEQEQCPVSETEQCPVSEQEPRLVFEQLQCLAFKHVLYLSSSQSCSEGPCCKRSANAGAKTLEPNVPLNHI